MNPETASAVIAVAKILSMIGTWPLGVSLFAAVFGPWVVMLVVSHGQDKRLEAIRQEQRERFEAVVTMYENNAELVRNYEKYAGAMVDTVRLNTESSTRLIDHLKTKTPCHKLLRKEGG